MRPLSLCTRPLARKALPSSAFRPRIRNLAVQSPQPPGSQPAPSSRPYEPPPPTKQAPSPPPHEVSSFAKVQRKPGALPAGYKAAERRSVLFPRLISVPLLPSPPWPPPFFRPFPILLPSSPYAPPLPLHNHFPSSTPLPPSHSPTPPPCPSFLRPS